MNNTGSTTKRLRKVVLQQIPLDLRDTMLIPAIQPKPLPEEQDRVVYEFLRHVDNVSSTKYVMANIYPEPDGQRVEVACDCGCNKRFIRHVPDQAAAWTTVHILNEATFTVVFLPKFNGVPK